MSDYAGVFFTLWAKVPVYHGMNWDYRDKPNSVVNRTVTRCGLTVDSYDNETDRYRDPGTFIPMQHAVKFGRPCKRCFP